MPHDMRERRNESNLNNDKGGVAHSAPDVSDNNARHGMSPDFRGLFDEGEAVTLVDGPEITQDDNNLGELFENDPSVEEEDLSDDGMQNGVSHPSSYVNDAADLSNNVGMVDGPQPAPI